MPGIGRFASADTIVPNEVDPQAWNRYSYVRNNPLIYNDPSGHCWGFASGMRDWTFLNYGTTCSNMDMAWNIVTHPNATLGERAGAGAYLAAEGGAHVGVAAGSVVVAAEVVGPVVAAGKTLLKTVLVYANMAYQAATAAYPTTTAVAGGVAETAAECAMTGGGCTTLDYVVGGATAGVAHRISTPQPHGNSALSTRPQHGYEIYNTQTNDVVKVGISGQSLNQNGTSPRANIQVNAFNQQVGGNLYAARVLETNMPGRMAGLSWEQNHINTVFREGNTLSYHRRPSPK